MDTGELGKVYEDGEAIVRQGEEGDCVYVVQEGQVESAVFLVDNAEIGEHIVY
ncbi:MAG: cyclic nucleotide-binding domain-containing protein [Chloroflexi bacterium]|nr:cyclic nucleotide-binding domain-containing protein [Chloroflexota bacterium]